MTVGSGGCSINQTYDLNSIITKESTLVSTGLWLNSAMCTYVSSGHQTRAGTSDSTLYSTDIDIYNGDKKIISLKDLDNTTKDNCYQYVLSSDWGETMNRLVASDLIPGTNYICNVWTGLGGATSLPLKSDDIPAVVDDNGNLYCNMNPPVKFYQTLSSGSQTGVRIYHYISCKLA